MKSNKEKKEILMKERRIKMQHLHDLEIYCQFIMLQKQCCPTKRHLFYISKRYAFHDKKLH
ncbi:CLUMA_CG005803, isoform A [Clunio marinus]|uniref:CLUMA_CG005803, isoform A n=1 Tax=Clunio marinus TaxID=568069 RepID=A0A1J1HVV7_9DIPT|nr:CLUMA_CG005803, isoform A [Clunio marinus]